MSGIPLQTNDSQADLDRPVNNNPPGRLPVLPAVPITAARGAVSGLAGGLVSGAALAQLHLLGLVAQLLGTRSATAGFAVHLIISATLGAGFGVLIRHQRAGAGETVFWGLAYGMSWWYAGTLTLLPLLTGGTIGWSVTAARDSFPQLLAYLVYGLVTALVFTLAGRLTGGTPEADARVELSGPDSAAGWRIAVRGAVAGTAATWVLTGLAGASGQLILAGNGHWLLYPIGAAVGSGYAGLYPAAAQAAGPAATQGAAYGFLLWVLLPLTVVPGLREGQLLWSADQVQGRFASLPAFVLLGTLTAGVYTALARLMRLLFAATGGQAEEEGVGARTIRAVGRGAMAGIVGGLLFTVIMVQIGYLGTVAKLVGSSLTGVGLVVHLAISVLIGASYGLLFHRQSHDLVSGVGWGVSYGFVWWVLGALTILPVVLGGEPQWSAQGAAAAFPSLVGHLVYGAGLGGVFQFLEARHDPWSIHRATAESRRALAVRRRSELETSAPAVWALVVVMAVTVTVVLGR